MNVDWSKYTRFFTFGCSFTSYMWPTWANVVAQEMPQAEFYNFGKSGSGNPLISYRIAEVNNKFKFTDTDLVMVMFSTYTREDRWTTNKGWIAGGNIFNNKFYPESWVREFADEKGYLIRDAAIIDMTVKYLQNCPCTNFCMLSVPFVTGAESPSTESKVPNDIKNIYQDTFNKFKPSFHDLIIKAGWSELEYDYPFKDGHPTTIRYYDYLNKIGFNLTEKSKTYAEESSALLKTIPNRNAVPLYFLDVDNKLSLCDKLVF